MSLIKVVKQLGDQKQYGLAFEKKPNTETVARVLDTKSDEMVGFVNMDSKSEDKRLLLNSSWYDVEPIMPMGRENFGCIISGGTGTGKSTLGAMFARQYIGLFPERPLFLISQKDKNIDRNFKDIEQLVQLGPTEIKEFNINDYKECLFIIDDSDYGKNAKEVFELLNLISTVGREYLISWIFITHINSRLNITNAYKEFSVYISYYDNLVNNRMLEQNMGFTKKEIDTFLKMKASYYVFNRVFNVLITDKAILKYK